MRAKNPYVLFVLALFLLSAASDQPSKIYDFNSLSEDGFDSPTFQNKVKDKIGIVEGSRTFFTVPTSIIKNAIKHDSISFLNYAIPENIFVDKLDFLTYNFSDYYLFASGTFYSPTGSELTTFTIAYELIYEADALYNMRNQQSVNMCTGVECSSCEFDTSSGGQIIGCKCGSGSGTCNHTLIALDAMGSGYSLLNIEYGNDVMADQ